MQYENVIKDFEDLPEIAKKEVADFIAFLKMRYFAPERELPASQTNLRDDPFIGLWKDRADSKDSTDWIRSLQKNEWKMTAAVD